LSELDEKRERTPMLGWLASALFILVAVLWVRALVDCVGTSAARVRYMPKVLWLLFIVGAPVFGALAWTNLGRRPVPRGERAGAERAVAVASAE
jgi:hypothetical protein